MRSVAGALGAFRLATVLVLPACNGGLFGGEPANDAEVISAAIEFMEQQMRGDVDGRLVIDTWPITFGRNLSPAQGTASQAYRGGESKVLRELVEADPDLMVCPRAADRTCGLARPAALSFTEVRYESQESAYIGVTKWVSSDDRFYGEGLVLRLRKVEGEWRVYDHERKWIT